LENANDSTKKSDGIVQECKKILEMANERHILLRAMGAVAFRLHCPTYAYFQDQAGRVLSDLDFASYHNEAKSIEKLFRELSYGCDLRVKAMFSDRLIFENRQTGHHADVFFDKLDMCHTINFRDQLVKDAQTIPLALLLLEKMQIVHLTEKDVLDTSMLLREHTVGDSDADTINGTYVSQLCAVDWGLWRTVTVNLQRTSERVSEYPFFTPTDRQDVRSKIEQLVRVIEVAPKSTGWKMRAKIGDSKKWYREIEDYAR